jgi:hypothetical protein
MQRIFGRSAPPAFRVLTFRFATLEQIGGPHGSDVPADLPKKLSSLVVRIDDCG